MSDTEELKFPLDWHYKIITVKSQDAVNEITTILHKHGVTKTPQAGRHSRHGKYLTYNVTVTFHDIHSMRALSDDLTSAECVKFLL